MKDKSLRLKKEKYEDEVHDIVDRYLESCDEMYVKQKRNDMKKNVIDKLEDLGRGYPFVVFSDNVRGFLNFGIKKRTSGSYSHVMILLNPDGETISQDFTGLRKINLRERYMKNGYRLKFYSIKNLSASKRFDFYNEVLLDVKRKWWRRRYDILGIFGQLLGIRKLNNPKTKYCSEDVIHRLKTLGCKPIDPHYNPSQLNKYMRENKTGEFVYSGHWFSD